MTRLVKWSMLLQSYDFTVEHKPGADNSNADGLSRQAEDGPSFEEREMSGFQHKIRTKHSQ